MELSVKRFIDILSRWKKKCITLEKADKNCIKLENPGVPENSQNRLSILEKKRITLENTGGWFQSPCRPIF
jgi:hypothetical protein